MLQYATHDNLSFLQQIPVDQQTWSRRHNSGHSCASPWAWRGTGTGCPPRRTEARRSRRSGRGSWGSPTTTPSPHLTHKEHCWLTVLHYRQSFPLGFQSDIIIVRNDEWVMLWENLAFWHDYIPNDKVIMVHDFYKYLFSILFLTKFTLNKKNT